MPSLRIYHRKTLMGGDDLQLPSLFTIATRFFQSAFLVAPVLTHLCLESYRRGGFAPYFLRDPSDEFESCRRVHYFPLLLFFHCVLSSAYYLLSVVVEWNLYKASSIGWPTQPELRDRPVRTLMEWKTVPLAAVNLGLLILGFTVLGFAGGFYECRSDLDGADDNGDGAMAAEESDVLNLLGPDAWWFAYVILLCSQLAEVFMSLLGLVRLFRRPKESPPALLGVEGVRSITVDSSDDLRGVDGEDDSSAFSFSHVHHHELAEQMWHDSCTSFCRCLSVSTCFLFGGQEIETGDYADVARALADYFETEGVLDLVPSDLAVGFVMLQRVQKERILEARRMVLEEMNGLNEIDSLARMTRSVSPPSLHADPASPTNCEVPFLDDGAGNGNAPPQPRATGPSRHGPADSLLLRSSSSLPVLGIDPSSSVQFRVNHQPNSSCYYEPNARKVLDRNSRRDREVMAEGARFARHALAIYTWMLYVYMHPLTGVCRILGKGRSKCGLCCISSGEGGRSGDHHDDKYRSGYLDDEEVQNLNGNGVEKDDVPAKEILGENLCGTHRSALLLHANLSSSDLVYAFFKSSFSETPYCIILDHEWHSVVLSIRGTLSLEDCVTDVLLEPESLDNLGMEFGFDAEGESCHGGVLGCARFVYGDLQRHGILDRLLFSENAKHPNYTLRIVGHSLGAGTATLLSYMLKNQYPDLRCLAYSPPGGFLSWRLATECKSFCTSFVLDSDLVPRLSVDNMEQLRDEVLELIGRIRVPKIEVAHHVFSNTNIPSCLGCGGAGGERWEDEDLDYLVQSNSDMLHPPGEMPRGTAFALQLERFKSIQNSRRTRRGSSRAVALFPPGRIIHLVKTGERTPCGHGLAKCLTCCTTNFGSVYSPVWAENDDFNEIVVSPTMGTDHFPNRVCLEIEGVANAFGIDSSLSSSMGKSERMV